jgi:hypothetical protein
MDSRQKWIYDNYKLIVLTKFQFPGYFLQYKRVRFFCSFEILLFGVIHLASATWKLVLTKIQYYITH